MKNTLLFAFLLLIGTAALAQPGPGGGVAPVITEIMYNPPEAGQDSLEFIEIFNPSLVATINMAGFYIDDAFQFTFPAGFILGAGEYVVIAGDSVIFEDAYGVEAFEWEGSANQLSNNGESISLKNGNDVVVDLVEYGSGGDWPVGANSLGYSLVLCNPTADNNLATNWTLSENATGLIVNAIEIYADPGAAAICTPTGISDDNVITTLVYPNPSNGEFSMQFEALASTGTVSIYNQVGQLVYTERIPVGATSAQLNTSLRSGQYVLTLEKEGAVERHRLTIN